VPCPQPTRIAHPKKRKVGQSLFALILCLSLVFFGGRHSSASASASKKERENDVHLCELRARQKKDVRALLLLVIIFTPPSFYRVGAFLRKQNPIKTLWRKQCHFFKQNVLRGEEGGVGQGIKTKVQSPSFFFPSQGQNQGGLEKNAGFFSSLFGERA
jgi:hypothetical protein